MFNQTLNNLPKPQTPSFSELCHTYYNEVFKFNLVLIGSLTVIIAIIVIIVTMFNKDIENKNKANYFLINFASIEFLLITLVAVITLLYVSATSIATISISDYLTDNTSKIEKILPGTDTKTLSIEETNNDSTGKSGLNIYYHDLKIAKIKNNKYQALNQQGKQYASLMNTLLKITKGKNYAVLKIKDTDTNNLKMSFIYQGHTYLVSFKNNSKTTVIKL